MTEQRVPGQESGEVCCRVGVVADPGLPSEVAAKLVDHRLPVLLGERVASGVRWQVELWREALPLNEQRKLPLLEAAARRKPQRGWDVLVYLTDLPRRLATEPALAEVSTAHGVVLVSLPAIGWTRLGHHVTETVVYLVGRVHQARRAHGYGRGPAHAEAMARSRAGRLLRRPTEWGSPVRERPSHEEGIDATLALVGVQGRLRLLRGMVRANRPWKLVPHLASATAAATATAAFGIFYSSIWSMADALSTLRLALTTLLSVAVMAGWLVMYNHLWDGAAGLPSRREAALYNASTLCTVFLGVLCMYGLLYVVSLAAAFVVIDAGYLGSRLGHPAGVSDYATLVWLACSMGIVAGALGSSLDSEEAVRNATYSRRERERQARDRAAAAAAEGSEGTTATVRGQ